MKEKKRFLSLLLCVAMLFSFCPRTAFAESDKANGLCEHHTRHTADCGYSEGSEGTPCGHEHTEDCYTLVTECVHEHGPECCPAEQETSVCTHVCSEESGCIAKELECQHEHDEVCGYAPATDGTPCAYICEVCSPQDSGETEETEPEAECVCTELCAEETVNADCPVCGAEGADLTSCEGMETEMATLSNALAAETRAAAEGFEVTGGTSGKDYSYSDGVLTVNDGANITISMASGATTPTSDRIVVTGNAEITLNGVNITGSKYDNINETDAQSAIDVSENATLILNLSESTQNTLTGGDGESSVGAPGIHVPESSSLVIQGSGGLSVQGGDSISTYGGSGIGGKSAGGSGGGTCGTVIILATGNVKITGGSGQHTSAGGADIGGGLGTTDGGNGQGIRPVSDQQNTYKVWGNLTLPDGITIPDGVTVTIPDGASLTVSEGTTLTNGGTILVQGGTFTNNGTVNGNQPTYPSTVTVSFSQNGESVNSVPYGSTVTITATMEKAATAANALSVDTGKVDFYLGAVEDGTKLNESDVPVTQGSDGTYTATLEVTLDGEDWKPNESPYTITADFGGYAPSEGTSGDSLAPNTGSAQLTVTKAEQSAPNGTFLTISSTENSITVTFTDVTQSENENGIEIAYAEGPTADVPTSDWTTAEKIGTSTSYNVTIDGLSPGTPYIFFARYKGDDTHKPSPPIVSVFVPYTKPKINTTSRYFTGSDLQRDRHHRRGNKFRLQ